MTAIDRYRSIWISDTHLGTRGCKVDYLLGEMRELEPRCALGVEDTAAMDQTLPPMP